MEYMTPSELRGGAVGICPTIPFLLMKIGSSVDGIASQ